MKHLECCDPGIEGIYFCISVMQMLWFRCPKYFTLRGSAWRNRNTRASRKRRLLTKTYDDSIPENGNKVACEKNADKCGYVFIDRTNLSHQSTHHVHRALQTAVCLISAVALHERWNAHSNTLVNESMQRSKNVRSCAKRVEIYKRRTYMYSNTHHFVK